MCRWGQAHETLERRTGWGHRTAWAPCTLGHVHRRGAGHGIGWVGRCWVAQHRQETWCRLGQGVHCKPDWELRRSTHWGFGPQCTSDQRRNVLGRRRGGSAVKCMTERQQTVPDRLFGLAVQCTRERWRTALRRLHFGTGQGGAHAQGTLEQPQTVLEEGQSGTLEEGHADTLELEFQGGHCVQAGR